MGSALRDKAYVAGLAGLEFGEIAEANGWTTSFHMKCMEDGCTGGGFDLAPTVAGLAKSRKKTTKGKAYCHGTNHTFGHASIDYEVNIQYHKRVK